MRSQLSPKELGEAIGVSESSIKRWIDEGVIRASRTAGGHRRIALADAVQFVRSAGLPVVRPQVFGLVGLEAEGGARRDPQEVLRAAVLDGLSEVARAAVLSMYLAGRPLHDICDGPLTSAMHAVGELWRHDAAGIYVEHRATDICIQALGLVRSLIPPAAEDAPVAMGGAPSGDPYVLPSMMAAAVLAAEGWHVINLGPQLPLDVLAGAVQRTRPRLVWVSTSVPGWASRQTVELGQLDDAVVETAANLVIGGRGWTKDITPLLRHATMARTMTELVAFAQGMRAAEIGPRPGSSARRLRRLTQPGTV